jgi:ABC-type uncharacterized transport system permease subunit
MGNSKNTLKYNSEENGRLDKAIVFNVLIMVMILACVSLVTLWQELKRSTFLRVFWAQQFSEEMTVLTSISIQSKRTKVQVTNIKLKKMMLRRC